MYTADPDQTASEDYLLLNSDKHFVTVSSDKQHYICEQKKKS